MHAMCTRQCHTCYDCHPADTCMFACCVFARPSPQTSIVPELDSVFRFFSVLLPDDKMRQEIKVTMQKHSMTSARADLGHAANHMYTHMQYMGVHGLCMRLVFIQHAAAHLDSSGHAIVVRHAIPL